jgi:hypothetical protein
MTKDKEKKIFDVSNLKIKWWEYVLLLFRKAECQIRVDGCVIYATLFKRMNGKMYIIKTSEKQL